MRALHPKALCPPVQRRPIAGTNCLAVMLLVLTFPSAEPKAPAKSCPVAGVSRFQAAADVRSHSCHLAGLPAAARVRSQVSRSASFQ